MSDMGDKERIIGYVDEGLKEDVETVADDRGESVSAVVAEALRDYVRREQMERLNDQYSIEQRMLAMIDDATRRVADETAETVVDELAERIERGELSAEVSSTDDGGDDDDWNLD